jgi:hypothetical protein
MSLSDGLSSSVNDPHDVVSCLKSFPFREDLRQNVMAVAESVMDFYTFETTAISSPSPFEDTKVDIRQEFQRIKTQYYDTDYDFNIDLYFTVNRFNDGHTMWLPNCYINVFQNLLPIPIVSLAKKANHTGYSPAPSEAIYVIPDANEFFSPFLNGSFHKYFEDKGIDVKRFEGAGAYLYPNYLTRIVLTGHALAEVTSINGQDPYTYVDRIANEYSGAYIERDIRQSMVYSSYRFADSKWAQRIGGEWAQWSNPLFRNTDPYYLGSFCWTYCAGLSPWTRSNSIADTEGYQCRGNCHDVRQAVSDIFCLGYC